MFKASFIPSKSPKIRKNLFSLTFTAGYFNRFLREKIWLNIGKMPYNQGRKEGWRTIWENEGIKEKTCSS